MKMLDWCWFDEYEQEWHVYAKGRKVAVQLPLRAVELMAKEQARIMAEQEERWAKRSQSGVDQRERDRPRKSPVIRVESIQ